MVAPHGRAATGEGLLVEATLAEVALNVAAEQVVEHDAYGVLLERRGNDPLPGTRFQGVFACDGGRDAWVAIACETDAQVDALHRVVGGDDVAAWCSARSPADAADALVAAGIPAADVIRQERAAFNEQLVARGFFEELDHPVVGRHAFPSLPFVFRTSQGGRRRWLHSPAPTLGQHNDEVLAGDLGLSGDELDRLRDDKLIGERPLGI
jgi:crotonobetainyl-CoA:carnitine CoA-transferase CaiB-like acyl-CoA transferase